MSERIAKLTLDGASIQHRTPQIEHERTIAMVDLMHENSFAPAGMQAGPYDVVLSQKEGRLAFNITSMESGEKIVLAISLQPLKTLVRDYFLVCESYYQALQSGGKAKLEAIDMGRRALHNEGAQSLCNVLEGKISLDLKTARRLFTLICVLHIK